MAEKDANNQEVILNLMQQQFHLDVFDGRPRSQRAIDRTSGYITGEASTEGSKQKVFYGLINDPDLAAALDEDSEDEEDKDKPKKKKSKKEEGKKRQSADPHAPKSDRIPFPKLKDRDKKLKLGIYREISKRLHVSKDKLPSICFYTFLNASSNSVTCVAFNDASTILAAGVEDSAIRIWSLSSRKLRTLKPTSELSRIDKEADDVMERVMNDKTAVEQRILYGHSGPVYALTFNEDDSCLLSASEDGTVRLWSLHAFACLVVFKGHNYPVWDVKFSPRGYYFATASHDRSARLWSVDSYQPLRIFAGHVADVTVVDFHPNCNYLATGSDDRSVRIWDILSGNMVRMYTGHKGPVQCVSFSPDGKHVVSSGVDARVMVWNISNGSPVAELNGHKNVVYTLCFSREGNVLASGGLDEYVKLWDMKKACRCDDEDISNAAQENEDKQSALQIASFRTKSSPILKLQFSRKNLLLASGPFLLPNST